MPVSPGQSSGSAFWGPQPDERLPSFTVFPTMPALNSLKGSRGHGPVRSWGRTPPPEAAAGPGQSSASFRREPQKEGRYARGSYSPRWGNIQEYLPCKTHKLLRAWQTHEAIFGYSAPYRPSQLWPFKLQSFQKFIVSSLGGFERESFRMRDSGAGWGLSVSVRLFLGFFNALPSSFLEFGNGILLIF